MAAESIQPDRPPLGGQLQENFYSDGTNALNLAINPNSQIQLEAKVGEFLLPLSSALRYFKTQFRILRLPVRQILTG